MAWMTETIRIIGLMVHRMVMCVYSLVNAVTTEPLDTGRWDSLSHTGDSVLLLRQVMI